MTRAVDLGILPRCTAEEAAAIALTFIDEEEEKKKADKKKKDEDEMKKMEEEVEGVEKKLERKVQLDHDFEDEFLGSLSEEELRMYDAAEKLESEWWPS